MISEAISQQIEQKYSIPKEMMSASARGERAQELTYSCMAAILALSESKDKSGKTGIGGAPIFSVSVGLCIYKCPRLFLLETQLPLPWCRVIVKK